MAALKLLPTIKRGMLEATNEHSTIRFTYNKLGLVETEYQDGYTLENRYDKLGNRIHLTSSLGADITAQRNALGLVTALQAKVSTLHPSRAAAENLETGALWQAHIKYNQAGHETERIMPGKITC